MRDDKLLQKLVDIVDKLIDVLQSEKLVSSALCFDNDDVEKKANGRVDSADVTTEKRFRPSHSRSKQQFREKQNAYLLISQKIRRAIY